MQLQNDFLYGIILLIESYDSAQYSNSPSFMYGITKQSPRVSECGTVEILLGRTYEGAIPSCLKLSNMDSARCPSKALCVMQGAFIMLKFSDYLFADVI